MTGIAKLPFLVSFLVHLTLGKFDHSSNAILTPFHHFCRLSTLWLTYVQKQQKNL